VSSQFGSIETEFISPVNSTVQGQGREKYIQARYCRHYSDLCKIWYRNSVWKVVKQVWLSWKLAQ